MTRSRLLNRRLAVTVASASTVTVASILILKPSLLNESLNYLRPTPLLNDTNANYLAQSQLHGGKLGTISPTVFIWGQDKCKSAEVKKPKVFLEDTMLRDLAIHEKYGAMVDEHGNVSLWGIGYSTSGMKPEVVLKGKNIRSISCSEDKIYALSMAGDIFIFPVSKDRQSVGAASRNIQQPWWKLGFGEADAGTDFEILKPDVALNKKEKFISISTGRDHLVALTSNGRAFASPSSLLGNSHGQLAVRKVTVLGEQIVNLVPDPRINEVIRETAPPARLDPLLLNSTEEIRLSSRTPVVSNQTLPTFIQPQLDHDPTVSSELEKQIRFCTTLHQIPSLRSLTITQIVAGERHTLARTAEGRIVGFGANNYGQLGLGSSLSFASIQPPTEIPIARAFPKTSRLQVERIEAGGNLSYFVVENEDISNGRKTISLLATGNGQFGGIGNSQWAHAAEPTRVKTISGLLEWNENLQEIEPIPIKQLSVGNTHIAVVLDNAVQQPGGIAFGRDVFVFGKNEFGELGTGKRNSLSSPQHLPPLPYPGLKAVVEGTADAMISSNTRSPMPHNRLQLAPEIKWKGKRVEETVLAGWNASAVYWKILDP